MYTMYAYAYTCVHMYKEMTSLSQEEMTLLNKLCFMALSFLLSLLSDVVI